MPTGETIQILTPGREAEANAAEALAAGDLVIAPTETVYGVFGTDRAALARLVGDDHAAAAAWHAPGSDAAGALLGGAAPAWQHRLLGRLLPGAFTVVAGDAALRVPDDDACRAMLRAAADAGAERVLGAAIPIGNGRTIGPLTDEQSAQLAAAGVSLVIDGGPTRLGQRSTVIRLTDSGYDVVREGAIEKRYLDKQARSTLLFVCTGNTCRSPMAAAIARSLIGDDPLTIVASAGLAAGAGAPMTPEARAALRGIGVEPGKHRSGALSEQDVRGADAVFAMTADHLAALEGIGLRGGGGAELLDPSGADVPDPIGGDQSEYDATCRRIEELVRRRLEASGLLPRATGPGDAS